MAQKIFSAWILALKKGQKYYGTYVLKRSIFLDTRHRVPKTHCAQQGSLVNTHSHKHTWRIHTWPVPKVYDLIFFFAKTCDFWLFPQLETQLKGTRFESRDDIILNTTAKLYSIPKEAFQKFFEQWRNRWEKFGFFYELYYDARIHEHKKKICIISCLALSVCWCAR